MPMVCSGNPPVCTWVPDETEETSEASNGGTTNGGAQPSPQAMGQNMPTGGSVMGEAPTTTESPKVATVPANSPTPANSFSIPNYNMNVFIAVAIIVAGLGVGYYFGRR